jgi:hypothetical protein
MTSERLYLETHTHVSGICGQHSSCHVYSSQELLEAALHAWSAAGLYEEACHSQYKFQMIKHK